MAATTAAPTFLGNDGGVAVSLTTAGPATASPVLTTTGCDFPCLAIIAQKPNVTSGGPVDAILNTRIYADVEYQDWILILASITCLYLFCLPCFCAGLPYHSARVLALWLQARLRLFIASIAVVNVAIMYVICLWLPNWTPAQYFKYLLKFAAHLASHLVQFAVSTVIIVAFFVMYSFKDRIFMMLGMEHVTMFRFSWRDCLSCWTMARFRPVEICIWKVEDLPSNDLFNANDVFCELFMGFNEPMRTRVHNNAGSRCVIKETMQINFDEGDENEALLILIKDQSVMGSKELGRLKLSNQEILMVEKEVGFKPISWNEGAFVVRKLNPRGKLWLRVAPVTDDDVVGGDQAPLLKELSTC